MATLERIITPVIADDGSIHYSSVMSPPDDSIAVCPMIPLRVIPVIFVPGIMGTNLLNTHSKKEPVWVVNSQERMAWDWAFRGSEKRKQLLDPKATDIYGLGELPVGATKLSDDEMRRRGWGEVGHMSYGTFLPWLENALNDFLRARDGTRADLMKELVAQAPGVDLLTHDEVAMSYRYQLPVHAVGYNWLQSNQDSAARLETRIQSFMKFYRDKGYQCSQVIVVTHSMGGLVARWHSEVDGHSDHVLGIVHGVMPATGAATAYKRVKAGTEGKAGIVLGSNAAHVTAVFAQSPGALQLLPSKDYGMGWLKVRDDQQVKTLPQSDPYEEIYLQRGLWWGLCDEQRLNPLDEAKTSINEDWAVYQQTIKNDVKWFHAKLGRQYHPNTYAFYGNDQGEDRSTWGDVVWKLRPNTASQNGNISLDRLFSTPASWDGGEGKLVVMAAQDGKPVRSVFELQPPTENGDGTVPVRSGNAPGPHVKVCIPFPGVPHEGAYQGKPQQLFTLWAITKIAYQVRTTDMAYR